ncbi:unnamed protein product [Prunus brigantina]
MRRRSISRSESKISLRPLTRVIQRNASNVYGFNPIGIIKHSLCDIHWRSAAEKDSIN